MDTVRVTVRVRVRVTSISPAGSAVESGGVCGGGGGSDGCGAAGCGGGFSALGGVARAEPSGGAGGGCGCGGGGGGGGSGADSTGRKVVTPTRWSLEVARVTPGSLCCNVPATARVRGCSCAWKRLQPMRSAGCNRAYGMVTVCCTAACVLPVCMCMLCCMCAAACHWADGTCRRASWPPVARAGRRRAPPACRAGGPSPRRSRATC